MISDQSIHNKKNSWKLAILVLVLCASCLMIGKCLRLFSKSGENTAGLEKTGENTRPGQECTDGMQSLLTEEQSSQISGFDAAGRSIVLDAGHGGFDPGKVGVNGALEKEINLQIVRKLEAYLKELGFGVTLTRTSDDALYAETDRNKKAADMKARIQVIESAKPDFAVSIHQNSFTQESSVGAQVFYSEGSAEGKKLAGVLQNTIRNQIADGNRRVEKANSSYYLLKKSSCPMVIVECGFLSNHGEAELLTTEDYQNKMAWAICLGIVEYCRAGEEESNTGE